MIIGCPACARSNRLPAARLRDKARCAACKGALLPVDRPVPIADSDDFDELVQSAPGPVLVDFWADWCGPCRLLAPELEKVAKAGAGALVVAKVDTEALPQVAGRFGIRSIPTMILFRGGKESQRLTGLMPASAILSKLGM